MLTHWPQDIDSFSEQTLKLMQAASDQAQAFQNFWVGMSVYTTDFLNPFWLSLNSFLAVEGDKALRSSSWETAQDYLELLLFNQQIAENGLISSLEALNRFCLGEVNRFIPAWLNTVFDGPGEDLSDFVSRQAALFQAVIYEYPRAIQEIKSEYGLHPEDDSYEKVAETDRFELYQVLPSEPKVKVNPKGKPVVIVPPYVLGANILAFLPGEKKSYVHAFANQGLPTYIRIIKEIETHEAVQIMTGEDDALDTRYFCEVVKARHHRPVTLNGFCQGGFTAVLDLLSGELDGLVDALITCVAPMDGTRSRSLVEYLQHLPPRFRDLGYAVKTLPNGNQIVDGKIMSWVYKLKSMDKETPLVSFFEDLMIFQNQDRRRPQVSKTAAAINHWLIYDRADLPGAITKLSFDSYTIPVTSEGTLPVKLFGQELNFNRLEEKGIKWLICAAQKDDLVDLDSALAPLDWVKAEVTIFPKGHGSIATSWSEPSSACALHTRFGDDYRGPVRFQLDLQEGS